MVHNRSHQVELAYESFGDPADEAILLIMGLGAQMLSWDTAFCKQLAAQHFYVSRFDNRDIGLSTKFDDAPMVDHFAVLSGDTSTLQYGLDEMAADAVALLDRLGITRAHIVGASMGAMIAQLVAINHPERVRSLVSIMGTTGARDVGQPHPDALQALISQPAGDDPEAIIDHLVERSQVWSSPDFRLTDRQLRAVVKTAYDRSYYPQGAHRQMGAVLGAYDRTEALGRVSVPTLVIHGVADKLVDVSGGEATAKAVPNSELMLIEGMGHDLPGALWPQIVGAIVANAKRQN